MQRARAHRDLHSFPTRRSSDLGYFNSGINLVRGNPGESRDQIGTAFEMPVQRRTANPCARGDFTKAGAGIDAKNLKGGLGNGGCGGRANLLHETYMFHLGVKCQ